MGLTTTPQHRAIILHGKELTASLSPSKQDLSLGLAGYVHIWIPNFSVLAHALHQTPRGPLTEPLNPTTNNPYFKRLQQALILASLRPLQTFQLMKTKCQTQPCHSYPFLTKISHSCREILDFKTPHFSNIDQPLSNPNYTWFIDGSSCSQPCSITRWTC